MQNPDEIITANTSPKRAFSSVEEEEEQVAKKQCDVKRVTPLEAGEAFDVRVQLGPVLAGKRACKVQVMPRAGFELDLKTDSENHTVIFAIMDKSGSMDGSRWANACRAIKHLALLISDSSQPIDLCIIVYDEGARVLLRPTLRPAVAEVEALLNTESPSCGTEFKPAMAKVMKLAQPYFDAKRPVVCAFFTDGEDASTLEADIKAFKDFGVRECALLHSWSEQERLCVHSVGIDIGTVPPLLRSLSTFGKRAGESLAITKDSIGKVMAALFAATQQVVPDSCVVKIGETLKVPVNLLVGDPEVVSSVACFVKAEEPVNIEVAIGSAPPFFASTLVPQKEKEEMDDDDVELITSALQFMCSNLVLETRESLAKLDFDSSLDKVTDAFGFLRTVSEQRKDVQVAATEAQLRRLQEGITWQKDDVRMHSETKTERGRRSYISGVSLWDLQSNAIADVRTLSGDVSLAPTGRQSSAMRTLSDAAEA
jgi:hypothetical protein